MKKSQLLKKAKKMLWNGQGMIPYGKEDLICLAIWLAWRNLPDQVRSNNLFIEEELCEWIHCTLMKLSMHLTLSDWLEVHHPEFPRNNTRKMQQLRHKWINWMIQYWEERGD